MANGDRPISALEHAIYSIRVGADLIDQALLAGTDEEISESLTIVEESVQLIKTWLTSQEED